MTEWAQIILAAGVALAAIIAALGFAAGYQEKNKKTF